MDLTLKDGIKLDLAFDDCPGTHRAIVIIVHGLAEHMGRYTPLTLRLMDAGYAVMRYDQRGHGRSEGRRIFFDAPDRLFDDLYQVVMEVKRKKPGEKIYLFGHSMGGFTVAGFATEHPGLVDGIILSGAMTHNSDHILKPLPRWLPDHLRIHGDLAGLHSKNISRDEAVVKAYIDDPLVEHFVTIGLARNFYQGVEYIKTRVDRWKEPTLILHGTADKLVPVQDSKILYAEIPIKDKELITYEGLYHEILNEPEKQQVMDDIIRWLNQRVP